MVDLKRIGIFGGSFDPVHLGHLLVAHAAREEMNLDHLIFMPANISPFKAQNTPAPESLRMRMLRLALAGMEWCGVSEMELNRGGVSYTIDTVRSVSGQFPGCRLFLLIGEDNLGGLSGWKEFEELRKLVEFLVIPRPGSPAVSGFSGMTLHRLEGWPIELSSSVIRQRIRDGLPVDHLVPPVVAGVIHHNQLYLR